MKKRDNYDRIFYVAWLEGASIEEDKRLEDYANFLKTTE